MLCSRSQHRWHAHASPIQTQQRRKKSVIRSHRLLVVATSEFWWEDEQEFDALTEVLPPKQVYITTPAAATQHVQQLKASTKFAAAFTSPTIKTDAEQIWQQLARAGPPLFLKVRTRETLQHCEQDCLNNSSSNTAAEEFWRELTSQTWRTELDYGLAGTSNSSTTSQQHDEQILVLLSNTASVQHLVQAAVADTNSSSINSRSNKVQDGIAVVSFQGWNQGETQQQLTSWSDQLKPVLQQLAAV